MLCRGASNNIGFIANSRGFSMKVAMSVLLFVFALSAFAFETADVVGAFAPVYPGGSHGGGPIWDYPTAVLFDGGPFVNSTGTGYGGADESIMEPTDGTYGWGVQFTAGNKIADDFVVPAGETWSVSSITVFGYQTGSGPSPTLNGVYLAIYDDVPTTGTLVYGDFTTNVFTSAAFTNCYRVLSGQSGNNQRPIMAATCNLSGLTLTAGDYWLVFQLAGTGSSGPWANPVTITGQVTTGNGMQYTTSGWAAMLDSSSGGVKGAPFIIEGTTTALERATWGSIKNSF